MKIVVLDGFTLNPGDLSWKNLEKLGDLTVYDRTDFSTVAVVNAIANAEIVFTNKTPITKEVLDQVPNVNYIGVLATGYNIVDTITASKLEITVTNIPAYGTQAVAQFVFGLLLEMCHNIGNHSASVYNGEWSKSVDFCYWNAPLIELEGKQMGIIGFGEIGQATAKLAEAFRMKVVVHTRTIKKEFETENLKFVSLEELLSNSDVVSLHCPLTDQTEGIINATSLVSMKNSALLINTSRGGLVVEQDLAHALNSSEIAAAAVDVVSKEPMQKNNPLLSAKNIIITPHIAWATKEARERLMNTAVQNTKYFLNGSTINKVN